MKKISNHYHLSIVIPAYNEAERLPSALQALENYISRMKLSVEIIIVDDGSQDDTCQIIKNVESKFDQLRLVRNKCNRGKGASIRRGVSLARGKQILFTDADFSTPIEEYGKLAKELEQGASIAIASRDVAGAVINPPQPLYRELMGKTFNRLVQLIVLPGIHDTQCGFKLFERSMARKIFSRMTIARFGFDVEILYLGRLLGATIKELPVSWHDVLGSKVSPLKDAAQMFFDLFRIRWRHRDLKGK